MVVATQNSRRQTPLVAACSDDSLARSLHKDVDYPAVNVSRRSPDDRSSPLAPDCRYPTPATLPGQRKLHNTLLDTGWHACFKNNNYVFVRNGSGLRSDAVRQHEEKLKESNASDVTFVISTTKPAREGQEKLIVSLQDTKPKIKRCAPSPPDTSTDVTPAVQTKAIPENSSGKRSKRSDKKKTASWLKKLRTPGRTRLLKVDATEEETTPIYESSPDDSPDSSEALPPPTKESKKSIAPQPPRTATPEKESLSYFSRAPHTSTPKEGLDTERTYRSLPRRGTTPHRPPDMRRSVRRRIPYEEEFSPMLECVTENAVQQPTPTEVENQSDLELSMSPLERRASCHRRIIESPDFQNRLQATLSFADIPYADSMEDVSFDERPRPLLTKRTSEQVIPTQKKSPFLDESAGDALVGSLPEMRSPRDAALAHEPKPISSSEPSLKIQRAAPCRRMEKVASPMEEEENRSLELHPQSLFSPDDPTVTFSPLTPKRSPPPMREHPVSCWLKELRLLTESECLNALQAKELIKEDWIANALAVGNAQETAEKVWEAGSAVTQHVEEMMETLKKPNLASTPFSLKVAQFCSAVVDLLKMGASSTQISQVETRIKKSCAELLEVVNNGEDREEWKIKMTAELKILQQSVQIIIQQFLLKHLQVIVECVERGSNMNCLKRAVFGLILLGRLGSTFCELITKLGAVRALLSVIVEDKWKELHPCALRALTVLSCVPSTIRSFEESGGVDCVCDVLCDEGAAEGSRSEAAGLVAQITAPWTEGSGFVLRSVTSNAERLVRSLAVLASKTDSSEVFLLTSAALANLSFAQDVLKKMKENKVLEILVNACRNSPHAASLFIKDQVATVLANMAAKEEYRTALSSGGSLVLLLCFLQLRPSLGHGAPQLAACERIQQKAAIALARLCSDPDTSNVVADMQGIQRLVKLCKDRKERNDSDSVLVACLAALRKIAAVRQKEEFRSLGAQELVEPRLWDAFLAHSSKRESYV